MVIAIIQARLGSTRLPSKVLKKIENKTLLELYINRLKPSKLINKVVIATTVNIEDDAIEQLAEEINIECFRGSENDLLDRYYQCAKKYNGDIVVRVTPDDPFVDYEVVDRAIQIYLDGDYDFVINHFEPTFPEGLDVEVYSINALKESWEKAKLLSEREHVFPYIQNNQNQFKIHNFKQDKDYSHLRWTIDHQCDFDMTKEIYSHLYKTKQIFLQNDILELLEKHPEIAKMNSHIKRKEGVNKTKENDGLIS